jgi:penicillin-binding protein 2
MFERRLKILLTGIVALSLLLFGRVFTVQVLGHSYWSKQAVQMLTRPQLTETTRGRILDIHNNVLATDTACTDACVDYRAIIDPPDPVWMKELAISRLRARLGTDYTRAPLAKKIALQNDEIAAVQKDIRVMWETLAQLNHPSSTAEARAAMNEIRDQIIQSVDARRQRVAELNRQREQTKASSLSKWFRWLSASDADDTSAQAQAVIAEQEQPHVVIKALDTEAFNFLEKHLDQLPGLSLPVSTHRSYPMHTIFCHGIGRMTTVSAGDLKQGPDVDELRQYQREDMIGREGVEALCEPLLRGSRGKIEKRISDNTVVFEQDFVPGSDVQLSIDAKLQDEVQQLLQHVEESARDEQNNNAMTVITPPGGVSMHAAAVVLDIKTNEVRVLASNPGFDVNDLADKYSELMADKIDEPLRDRATSDACEPGSTVKPLIGLGAITQGILSPTDTIECTGWLYLPAIGPDGRMYKMKMPRGRCWVLSEFGPELKKMGSDGSHHPIPTQDPHPTGFLTFADALERSCDIYFETLADRLKPEGVNHWYEQFGMGRITGIGIHEEPGLRPALWKGHIDDPRMNNCWAGMGEGTIWATPLQVANEAATIARGGIWMRPRLLTQATQEALDAVKPRSGSIPDQVDLHLSPEALAQARVGMINAVDGRASTGKIPHAAWLTIAAKTGTADTSPLSLKINGERIKPVPRFGRETSTPWYRSTDREGKSVVHSWYMGYAPADHPQIAFAVLIEYAGVGGGPGAGVVTSHLLEACEKEGYLHPN